MSKRRSAQRFDTQHLVLAKIYSAAPWGLFLSLKNLLIISLVKAPLGSLYFPASDKGMSLSVNIEFNPIAARKDQNTDFFETVKFFDQRVDGFGNHIFNGGRDGGLGVANHYGLAGGF